MLLESHVSSGGSTRDLARKYFSELDIMMVRRLYEFYKVDFEMFGYSPDEYFEIAKNSETQTPSSPDPSSVLPSTITDSSETSQASRENR